MKTKLQFLSLIIFAGVLALGSAESKSKPELSEKHNNCEEAHEIASGKTYDELVEVWGKPVTGDTWYDSSKEELALTCKWNNVVEGVTLEFYFLVGASTDATEPSGWSKYYASQACD